MSGFDLSKEAFDADYTVVADGVYMLSEEHTPGGLSHIFPIINNRGFVFCVKNAKGEEHLLMNGIPTHSCIPKLRKVEEITGLKLTLIVGSGDYHHMAMKDWLDEFPEVKIVMSGLKFPKTRNGDTILKNESYKKRIELVTGPDFPSLEQYKDVVQFTGFNQFYTSPDAAFTSSDIHNTVKTPKWKFLYQFSSLKPTQKYLAVWTYHVPTKQLIYEHNFNFFFSEEHFKQFNFPFNLSLPKEQIKSCANESLPTGPKSLEECKEHCRQMAMILDLDVRAMMEYHSLPGVMAGKFSSKEDYHEKFSEILEATGEHQADGLAMHTKMNPSWFFC